MCTLPITRGKNKGRLCREANKTCRHQILACHKCREEFSYKHTHTAHIKLCTGPKIRKKVVIIKKNHLLDRIESLEAKNKLLEDKVTKVALQPRNIIVLGNDFFQELVEKIGKERAVEFLTCTAMSGKPIDVIDKLYLEGKDPMTYPIACRNQDHFRYLNAENDMVDDRGGAIIGDFMSSRIQNAFIMAANELISHGISKGNTDTLYDTYNIVTVQESITTACDKQAIVNELAKVTDNSEHPFFKDETE